MMPKFCIAAAAVFLTCVSPALAQSQTIYDIAAGDGNFSTLATALKLTHLDDVLDCKNVFCRFTAFAPTDGAFAKLPSGLLDKLVTEDWDAHLRAILLYHVAYGIIGSADIKDKGSIDTISGEPLNTTIEGNTVKINDAKVIQADVKASNGVVHVIDGVLIPPFMSNDVIATAKSAGIFNTLLAAVDAAGLTATLQGDGPFTLFAPTDSAFETLGETAVQSLLKDIPTLTNILKYHVIGGEIVLGSELGKNNTLTTIQGEPIDVHIWDFWFFKYIYLNEGVHILMKDILTSNGVIHVVRFISSYCSL
jgi:transforming growth factor-beta-induced protein